MNSNEKNSGTTPDLENRKPFYSFFIAMLVLSLLATLLLFEANEFSFYYGNHFSTRPLIFSIISTLSTCLLFFFFLYLNRMRRKRKDEEEARLLLLEAEHRKELEQTRKELLTIKESFTKEFLRICELIRENRSEDALSMVEELDRRIESTREFPYCPNAVINSILTEKMKVCRENNIECTADLIISDCASIKKIHLCSIMSNLLDNAIHACCALPDTQARTITITGRESGGYLHLKVTNPTTAAYAHQKTEKGHGYGLTILKEIAGLYHGKFVSGRKGEFYESVISLECKGGSEQ